jgi:ABC-type phosphate/phosphonate transport system substrate-binding protein
MNYTDIDNDWDQQLRDAMLDMPSPSDDDMEELINALSLQYELECERYNTLEHPFNAS